MKKTNKKRLFFLLALTNLLIAYKLSLAADVSGSITINPCSTNCLVLTSPTSLSINTPQFLSPTGGKIFANFNYNLNQKLEVTDRRYSGGFRVDLSVSNLNKIDDSNSRIASTQIGVISFNNSATTSVDSTPSDNTVVSLIDPVVKNSTVEPFSQNEFTALTANPPTNYENYFTFLTDPSRSGGNGPTILNAPTASGRFGNYSLGLGFVIQTPANPYNISQNARALRDGQYQTTLTFSLLPEAI